MISPFTRSLVAVVGIDDYGHGIPPLSNAGRDAAAFGRQLGALGYEVRKLLAGATLGRLRDFLREICNEDLGPDDRLVFYFAGHGREPDATLGKPGCLLASDADPLAEGRGVLPMSELRDFVESLRCRHLLVILDCCYAGSFRWAATTRNAEILPTQLFREHYERYFASPARQVLTSAAHDQQAHDVLWGLGHRSGGDHSPFAEALFDALDGAADLVPAGGDGLITTTELFGYLRQRVVERVAAAGSKMQTPGCWSLPGHEAGEFVFEVPGHEVDLLPAPELEAANSPYLALETFTRRHYELFFGRRELVAEILRRLDETPWVVLAGLSGSGKSSVLQAGVLPALAGVLQPARGAPPPPAWRVAGPFRPGGRPLAALDAAFADLHRLGPDFAGLAPANLLDWLDRYPDERLVIAIDQLDELVTASRPSAGEGPAESRDAFETELSRLLGVGHPRLKVIVTVRLDFEAQLEGSPAKPRPLDQFWRAGRMVVPPMDHVQLREAILGPASQRALFVEEELVRQLIEDVQQMPGVLSLLSVTLSELYDDYVAGKRYDRRLRLADYVRLGRVGGSIDRRADRVVAALEAGENGGEAVRARVERVLLRMVSLRGPVPTRQPVLITDLDYGDKTENARVEAVLTAFEKERLIVPTADGQSVEPAHDMLISGWQQLKDWIAGRQADLLLQTALGDRTLTAGAWWNDPRLDQLSAEHQRPAGWRALLPGELAVRWKKPAKDWLNRHEREFYATSLARRRRRQTTLWALVTSVGVASVVAALVFYAQNERNRELRFDALTQSLTEQVQPLLTGRDPNPKRALQLAVQAERTRGRGSQHHRARVEAALREALNGLAAADRIYQNSEWDVQQLTVSPAGDRVAAAVGSRLLVVAPKTLASPVFLDLEAGVRGIAFSPSGQRVGAVDWFGNVYVWDLAAAATPDGLPEVRRATVPGSAAEAVVFLAEASLITSHSFSGDVGELRSWRLTGEELQLASAAKLGGKMTALAVAGPDLFAGGACADALYRWNEGDLAAEPERMPGIESNGFWSRLSLRPDGERLAGLCGDQQLAFWRPERPGRPIVGTTGITAVAFDPLGEILALARGGSFELQGTDFPFDLIGAFGNAGAEVADLTFAEHGQSLIVAAGKTLRRWPRPKGGWRVAHSSSFVVLETEAERLAFHPTNPNLLAVANRAAPIEIWDLEKWTVRRYDRHRSCLESLADNLVISGREGGDDVVALAWIAASLEVVERDGERWSISPQENAISCKSQFAGGRVCATAQSADGVWQAQVVGSGLLLLSAGADPNTIDLDTLNVAPRLCGGTIVFSPQPAERPSLFSGLGTQLKKWRPPVGTEARWTATPIQSFDEEITALGMSPGGEWLVAGGAQGMVWIWQRDAPVELARVWRPGGQDADRIESVVVGSDLAIAAAESGRIYLIELLRPEETPVTIVDSVTKRRWTSLAEGENQFALATAVNGVVLSAEDIAAINDRGSASRLLAPALSADGATLAVAVDGGQVRLLPMGLAKLSDRACRLLTENLSLADWRRYVGPSEPYERTCKELPVHPSLLKAADDHAEKGEEDEARVLYRHILEIQPDAGFDKASRLAAWKARREVIAKVAPEPGRLTDALAAFTRFQHLRSAEPIPQLEGATLIKLCLWPLLLGRPAVRMDICELAAESWLEPNMDLVFDARGLARARAGDLAGAAADFKRSQDALRDSEWREKRKDWIAALEVGKQPIDNVVLADLRREYLGSE